MVDSNSRQQRIWQVLALIPAGRVATYGQVAHLAGLAGGARYVGYCLKNLPACSTLPWHRVINSRGQISFPAGSSQFQHQQARLQAEGVDCRGGKIALSRFQWHGQ
jgi:methylated-DNA-protein-cysteine methyltransferase-like protein